MSSIEVKILELRSFPQEKYSSTEPREAVILLLLGEVFLDSELLCGWGVGGDIILTPLLLE